MDKTAFPWFQSCCIVKCKRETNNKVTDVKRKRGRIHLTYVILIQIGIDNWVFFREKDQKNNLKLILYFNWNPDISHFTSTKNISYNCIYLVLFAIYIALARLVLFRNTLELFDLNTSRIEVSQFQDKT